MRLVLTLLLFCILTSCSKNESGNNDATPPDISISSPSQDQVFTAGTSVSIAGTITDKQKVYLVHTHISDNTTGTLLIDIHRYPEASTYTLAESFAVAAGKEYRIQVVARDNAANESSATRIVRAN